MQKSNIFLKSFDFGRRPYLSNFLRLLELMNCKVGLILKLTKSCVLAAAGIDNANAYSNKFILLLKTQNYMFLPSQDNQKLSKLLSKIFERSVYQNEYRTKSKNKNMTHQYRYLLKSYFVGVNRLGFFCLFKLR